MELRPGEAQVVKVKALLFARDVLGVKLVRTNHNALNEPMIAIDRKFGYVQCSGYLTMRKYLAQKNTHNLNIPGHLPGSCSAVGVHFL